MSYHMKVFRPKNFFGMMGSRTFGMGGGIHSLVRPLYRDNHTILPLRMHVCAQTPDTLATNAMFEQHVAELRVLPITWILGCRWL